MAKQMQVLAAEIQQPLRRFRLQFHGQYRTEKFLMPHRILIAGLGRPLITLRIGQKQLNYFIQYLLPQRRHDCPQQPGPE